jgi:carbamoyl-phosphate synthase large subunit
MACLREIGVDTGGSNVQFAIHPRDGRMVIIEMNPRVSRAARPWPPRPPASPSPRSPRKLAVGYRLDEIPNDITQQ